MNSTTTVANSMPDNNSFLSPMPPSIVVDMDCGELHSIGATNSLFYGVDFSSHSPEVSYGLNRPDLYQEDDMEAGPRILSTPVVFTSNADVALMEKDSAIVIETASVFNDALVHHSKSKLGDAMEMYQTCVNIVVKALKKKQTPCCRALLEIGMRAHNNIGQMTYVDGKYKAAEAHFQASLLFSKQLAKACTLENRNQQLEYSTILSNKCHVLWRRGEVSVILCTGLQDVLRIRSSVLPWNHSDVAAAHFNLGAFEFTKMNNPKAVEHFIQYIKVVAHRIMSSQESDLDVIPALSYLLLIQNEHTEDWTSQLLLRGIFILQGKNHHGDKLPVTHDVANILNAIASLLFNKGDMEMSLLFFQEELRVREVNFQDNNPMCVSIACHNIGRVLQELQNDEQAVAYYERALKPIYGEEDMGDYNSCKTLPASKADLLSISHINFLSTVWYNLGLLHVKLASRAQAAICAFVISLEFKKSVLGSDYGDIACLNFNIGVLEIEENRPDVASKYLEQVLHARRQYLEITGRRMNKLTDELCVRALQKLALKYKNQNTNINNNIQAAINTLREVLRILINTTELDSISRIKDIALARLSISEHYHTLGDLPSGDIQSQGQGRSCQRYFASNFA